MRGESPVRVWADACESRVKALWVILKVQGEPPPCTQEMLSTSRQ